MYDLKRGSREGFEGWRRKTYERVKDLCDREFVA